jgi:type IV pilus assembly protein PilB
MAEVHAVVHAAPVVPSREPQRVDLEQVTIDRAAASVLPVAIARRHHVVPIGRRFGTPVVAMADPHDLVAVDLLRATLGRDFIAVVSDPGQIEQCLERVYGAGPPVGGPLSPDIARRGAPALAGPPAGLEPEPLRLAPRGVAEGGEVLDHGSPPPPPPSAQVETVPAGTAPAPAAYFAPTPPAAAPARASSAEGAPPAPAEASQETVAHVGDAPEPEMVVEPPEVPGEDEPASELAVALHVDDASLPPLARVLVEGKRVPLEVMREVLEERDRTGMAITRILTNRGLVTEADLMWGMAQEMGLEFVDLDLQAVDFASAYALPEATARHHNVLLVGYGEDGTPVVAASNPTDVFAMDDLRTILGRNFTIVVATRSQINTYIDRAYTQGGDAGEVAASAASDFTESDEDLAGLQAVVDDAPIVRYVNLLILQALNERASDIHVEPTADNLRIRYRIDGVLHDISTAPRAIAGAVTTRLKVMADINIAEHRIPQDGRISLNVGSRQIDLRIATLPTIHGEKVVMRVLDKSNVVLGFEDLGFDDDLLELYQQVYTKPYGTILVTGPTGSGKTTTLYATLAALNSPDRNIITVEDPVELRIKGINQVQLNVKAGLTFASALRSILRSDPDILLVGEIRDRETAIISVEAALTGHLVLATLHTNSAAATPMRLVEMGLEPYLVTSALSAALAQRLIRRLCVHCREPFEATEAAIVAAGWAPEEVFARDAHPVLYRAAGCSACSKTGYRGRKALLELLVVTDEIERLIVEGGTSDDIHTTAVEQGMVTLRQRGLRKALEGETTLEEVLRVVA